MFLRCILCCLFLISLQWAFAQTEKPYFQQAVSYKISGTLDDVTHEFKGKWALSYKNNAAEALPFIYMHLWPNAYQNTKTAFAKQMVRNGKLKFQFDKDRGGLFDIAFMLNGKALVAEPDPKNPDIVKLLLPTPLQPGAEIEITTDYVLDIPNSTSRLGHVGQSYQMTQWYPKPAVFDRDGWHAMPYLNQGEFYSDFGDFDVTITLPANYVVGATGELLTPEENKFLAAKVEESTFLLASPSDNIKDTFPPSDARTKTIRYQAKSVHDFAWFADKRFYVQKGIANMASGRKIDTWALFTNADRELWKDATRYIARAVEFYSANVGEYPYPHATAVMSALSAGGGMEYPMITVIGKSGDAKSLDLVITHEVGHNWFYGILASNERDHPWMDEGLNTFYEQRYTRLYYEGKLMGSLPDYLTLGRTLDDNQLLWELKGLAHEDQAPDTHSDKLEALNYGFSPYSKPALSLFWLEQYMGKVNFDEVIFSYFREWKFKHPQPKDFRDILLSESQGKNVAWLYDQLLMTDKKPDYAIVSVKDNEAAYEVTVKNRGETSTPFNLALVGDSTLSVKWLDGFEGTKTYSISKIAGAKKVVIDPDAYTFDLHRDNNTHKINGFMPKWEPIKLRLLGGFDNPNRNTLYVLPLVAYNRHDGTMPGLALHNGFLPTKRFNWVLMPFYSFKERQNTDDLYYKRNSSLRGLGNATYQFFPDGALVHGVRMGVEVSRFASERYTATGEPIVSKHVESDYTRWSGFISLLPQHSDNTHKSSDLTLRYTQINVPIMSGISELIKPEEVNNLLSLTYQYSHPNKLMPRFFKATLENIGEDLATNSAYRAMVEYKIRRAFFKGIYTELRLFGGATLGQTNTIDPLQVPLAGASVYDLGADHFYFNRNDRFGSSRQLAPLGAGLKVPITNLAAYAAFASPDASLGINLSTALPAKRWKFIRPYVDFVYTTNKTEKTTTVFGSSGLQLSFFKSMVQFNFPLLNTTSVEDLLPKKYSERITFTFDLPIQKLFNGQVKFSNFLADQM